MISFLGIPYVYAAVDASALGKVLDPIISEVVYPIIEVLFGLAVLIFVYGVLQLVIRGDDQDARKTGKDTILWGSVGIFIMVSAWGIIYLISNTIKG